MDCPMGGEGPAILQLRKWDPSQFHFNLSEFREAFISPTRELLLLLSYQCEALLLPLVTGDSVDSDITENCHDESLRDPCSAALSRSDSKDNTPCTSGSVMDFDNGFSLDRNFSRSNDYPFVCDVNSLAWGVCGDTYNQHKDALFRELLFVSGEQHVTVHAFCCPTSGDTSSTTTPVTHIDSKQGRWVEWGPSSTSVNNRGAEEPSSLSSETAGNVEVEFKTKGSKESSRTTCKEAGDAGSSRIIGPKRWLRSFFTKAETIKSDGNFWTRFPQKSSFPHSAKVISFTILDSSLPLLQVPIRGNSVAVKENRQDTGLDLLTNSDLPSPSQNCQFDVLPNYLGIDINSSYKCTRVFSSNLHYLIGFFLTLVDPSSVSIDAESEKSRSKKILLVAKLNSWGIQWVSAVKLKESLDTGLVFDWADFCFSDNLVVCLNSFGLIFFYDATSGNYVAHLDILRSCGLDPRSHLHEQGRLPVGAEVQINQVDEVHELSTHQRGGLFGGRMFKRVLVASYTSLLAVVDEYGIIYVIRAGDHILEKYNISVKLLPHHSALGLLFGWEACGSDIGRQRVYSKISASYCHSSDISSERNSSVSLTGNIRNNLLHECQHQSIRINSGQCDFCLNGFSVASKMTDCRLHYSEVQNHLVRKVFLPTDRFAVDDCIFFSPLGITRLVKKHSIEEQKSAKIVHFDLHTDSVVHDDSCLNSGSEIFYPQGMLETSVREAVGCTFQGCFYLITEDGLSVVLPAVSVPSNFLPVETIGYRQSYKKMGVGCQAKSNLRMRESKQHWSPWKVEILDRVILYEGPEEADRLCVENGWELKFSRTRQLQMALEYLKFDEIKQSLEMLVDVDLVEDGILRLLFAAVYLMSHRNGNDNEISAASRLLTLATSFATKMIRKYGLQQHKDNIYLLKGLSGIGLLSLPAISVDEEQNDVKNFKRLYEMAHFLEIIRNLQCRLSAKFKRPGQGPGDGGEALSLAEPNLSEDKSQLMIVSADAVSLDTANQHELSFSPSALGPNDTENLALVSKDSMNSKPLLDSEDSAEVSLHVPPGAVLRRVLPLENPKDMIARWKLDNLDLKTVVRDALLSGRLPLAVLQLHLHRSAEFSPEEEHHDTFTVVRDIGRAIAYDLFLKGETGLAVATLQRLGEDIEVCLKELVFGTVRRSLRMQIAEELRKYGYLGPCEWKMLERISLLERLYPSSSFWKTFRGRQKEFIRVASTLNSPGVINLHLLNSHLYKNLIIQCGEIDGVVLGSWTNVNESLSEPVVNDDNAHTGYWAAAAVWSNAWDQRTIDRVVLDQPFLMGVHVLWESQLEYHISHNEWQEVSKLLDIIPKSVLSDRSLQIAVDGSQSTSTSGCNSEFSKYGNYICSIEELDAMCMDVPDVKIFRSSANLMCSMWLRMLMEQELAKKFIFLKEYWEGTAEIVNLLARSGFITSRNKMSFEDDSIDSLSDLNLSNMVGRSSDDTMQALHKVFIHHCAQQNLPNLLDLYLDHHKLVLDSDSLNSLQEAVGDCHWARWLLLSRIKGHEYDASFCNARAIMSHNLVCGNRLSVLEIDDIICTVDDIAEGGWEMAALATLMYAPVPIQNCLSSGGVNRHSSSSAQCTLENLRPTLQQFPTLWRTLVAACFGQDTVSSFLGPKVKNALSDYLNWRDSIFFSSGRDTSLSQILPCWFPKGIRRLIQLVVQGPLGWQSLPGLPAESSPYRDIEYFINAHGHAEFSAISWEAAIQKHIEEELYDSSLQEKGVGLEHHLHRGRALAAFNHLLGVRAGKLKSEGRLSSSAHGQANIQSDVQTLLAPILQSEESVLASVMPLAISHFEDSVLVASSAFLLELCGLSASRLRVDIAALRRISFFYKSSENSESHKQLSPKGSAFHAISHEGDVTETLARALADEYLHEDSATKAKQKGIPNSVTGKYPSRALMLVLQHLEKASLPVMVEGRTCGTWLSTGNGDGAELRSQQKAASQHWNLVTVFCQMHQLPLSTKYLAVLARDNDWVGFLNEAQVGGYPFETVVQVASKEFSDSRLKLHILTVLKGMQSRKKPSSSSYLDVTEKSQSSLLHENLYVPVELFGILADCEQKKNPGEALLIKAKELSWSVLAMIASCFPDVTPLSCLTVWLEITAARETSSIKVNDIASQIADNVAAGVEATNSLPAGARPLTFHYNRRNTKRRRLMESIPAEGASSDVSNTYPSASILIAQESTGDEGKIKVGHHIDSQSNSVEGPVSLSRMVAVLCEQHLFLPLLRAFEMFLPSCSLLPFVRALQAFSQMRLSEASAHLGSFSARIKEEPIHLQANVGREGQIGTSWVTTTAVKAADVILSTCPSPYEKRCLLQLLAAADFGDGGSAAANYRRLYWKINLAEPSLRKDDDLQLGNETLDDASLLTALEKNGHWEQARNWAKQLEASGGPWKSAFHHVTETQAESMVAEWKEFLWDVPEERVALWGHCQTLFIRYSFPPLQAGLFFLKHAEALEKDLPARELYEMLLLSLQWLSGMITQCNAVYPLHLLREIETRVWLLAVESEAQVKSEGELSLSSSIRESTSNIIDRTANIITKMDNHINSMRNRIVEKYDARENSQAHYKNQVVDASSSTTGGSTKAKRRAKGYVQSRRQLVDSVDKNSDPEDSSRPLNCRNDLHLQDESPTMEMSFPKWEERVGPAELERAVLSLLEFGQITAAKQLQHKLSPAHIPSEFILIDAALKLAASATPNREILISMLDEEVHAVIKSYNILTDQEIIYPLQVLESFVSIFTEGSGRGLCKRIISVVKAANVLGLSFLEAFDKRPVELLQLLSLKAQESFEEAYLLVQTHPMPATSIAKILAESFLKGLLAAHRGGYMDSQKEEGPAPLLWRFSDFLKWAELCPSEPEIGHALMRLVITGQEIPHACEVELLILSHHFYKSSACLDGVDVLVALAATRVEAYVSEGDFPCLARLITGVGNFHALNFILGILIENGQLDLLLQKYSAAADTNRGTAEAIRGFRMAVLTSLKHFNPNDLDAFAMVYNHFDMKHEMASLLESRAEQSCQLWFHRADKDQNQDLLDAMRYFIEAAEVHRSIDAGNKTHRACAQASLVSLQIRMPDSKWLNLSNTNARRALVDQSRFQEALIVAEAYGLNLPSEWAVVLWGQMLNPELIEEFVADFVAVLPLQPSMLIELAKFYRAEMAARGDQSQFSVWLAGSLPPDWAKYLGRSFKCLLKRTRDLRLRMQLASLATGFTDITNACLKELDRVPDTAAPLVLRRGHGGAYLPLM